MSDKVLHQSHTIPTDGVGEKPSFSPEQIEEYNITPEELAATGQAQPEEESSGKILGKFESQEDLEAAYKELEKKLHEPSDNQVQADDDTPTELPSDEVSEAGDEKEPTLDDEEPADTASGDAGEVVATAFEALQSDGEVTEDVYGKFEKAGISKELVDHVKELQQFKDQAGNRAIQDSIGGEDSYGKMVDWAGNNLSDKEIDIFDSIMDNGTPDEVQFAVSNLNSRMENATQPKQSRLIKADAIAAATGGYPSQAHMLADMKDPRYNSDPSFRDRVMAKSNSSAW
tara:strand:+ start:3572 stop:4429 length:858 start_codon:yes stop_codon:yes gene_type:complete